MSREDPHAGKHPPAPEPVIEHGTYEHAVWRQLQLIKNAEAVERFKARQAEIGRPIAAHIKA